MSLQNVAIVAVAIYGVLTIVLTTQNCVEAWRKVVKTHAIDDRP